MTEDRDSGSGASSGPGGESPQYEPPSYGPNPYGPNPYAPSPYGPNPYAPNPYGTGHGDPRPRGRGPAGTSPYGAPQSAQSPYGPPEMLAASADRDRVIDVLTAAYGEGRLTKDEFDMRCARVMSARRYGELTPIVADLPGGSAFGPPSPYPGYYPTIRPPLNGLAVGSLVCSILGFMIPPSMIAGLVMGYVSRGQIRRTGERGDGVAISGLVVGYIALAFWALLVVAATHG